jgi:hypothetical protein
MIFRVPDWLDYEIRHKIERLRDRYERLQIREALNESPAAVLIVALFSVLLLGGVWCWAGRETAAWHYPANKKAWFYDLNTGELFSASGKQIGPTEAPSGPLPEGGLAGFRAHVYSYVLEPNASERFVGFLEKPDPDTDIGQLASARADFAEWTRGRLIRRVDDDQWVSPTSPAGREIIENLTRPNRLGQTPIYHVPK